MELIFEKIEKSYGNKKALSEFSTILEPGIYGLLGPNGSGKSTLMNIISENIIQDSGNVLYKGNDGEAVNISKMGVEYRRKLGYMPQYPGMYPNFTCLQFLSYMATLKDIGHCMDRKSKKIYINQRIKEVLEAVRLTDVSNNKINTLSGGMKKRLALAQAIIGDPEILILDEPTAGLDPSQRIIIRNLISQIALHKIVLIATHVVSDIEFIAKNIILLKKGKIIDNTHPDELTQKIEGMVWLVPCSENEISHLQATHRVINICKDNNNTILLRILSEESPTSLSFRTQPTLEDYYLYEFGSKT